MAALSPDGRRLALVAGDPNSRTRALMVMPAEGGQPRELLRTSSLGSESLGGGLWWSPDGKFILFRKGPNAMRETFRIPAEGGTAVKYGAEYSAQGPPAMHPDGRQVAFPMGQHRIEIWAMENFLPNAKRN